MMIDRQAIILEPLNKDNWLAVSRLSVSKAQKEVFPIANVYWIGISRYEERTGLFAIKHGEKYAGLIGGGLDEDGASGYINPLMVDESFQRRGIGREAVRLMMEHLRRKYGVGQININHRRENEGAARLYESLGFKMVKETKTEVLRTAEIKPDTKILSLREFPERLLECQEMLRVYFLDSGFIRNQTAEPLAGNGRLPQGYFMLKDGEVIGWAGLIEKEPVERDGLSPWISPLLIVPHERGRGYGGLLLSHTRKEAGLLGFERVYLATDHIDYYERYGFKEIGLTSFNWGRPAKIYQHLAIKPV